MEKLKLTTADINKVRHLEGFPIAKDEDIIALSDAPYYTACPNPFIEAFINKYGTPYNEDTDDYHCEPFAADVGEGKNDPIYNAHSYHTKVPHKAIMRYILHYTEPGDIVFDGFCGTGMTGVAAQMCGSPDAAFKTLIESEASGAEWGARRAILSDLSPAATFIAYNYNKPVDVMMFRQEAQRILDEVEKECGWMYETRHVLDKEAKPHTNGSTQSNTGGKQQPNTGCNPQLNTSGNPQSDKNSNRPQNSNDKPVMGRINYTVWSDVFICPTCSQEFVFWDVAVDKASGKVHDLFNCPTCGSELKKTHCTRAAETRIDSKLNNAATMAKQVPVLINYSVGKKRYEKTPDEYDLVLLERIESMEIEYWYPTDELPDGDKTGEPKRLGVNHIHQFYTRRCLAYIACLNNAIINSGSPLLKLWFTSQLINISKLNRYRPKVSFPYNPLSGTLYISSMVCESTPRVAYEGKIKKFSAALMNNKIAGSIVSLNSTTQCSFGDNTIDYIFTDPPFGANLNYSELSFIWESWLKVITNSKDEAIVSRKQNKRLPDYQTLMIKCFSEYYRVLKPGRWMTVEFHNSQNAVWNAIQEALQRIGFIIADVRTINKQQGSFNQVTSDAAVKQDLVISAYKPKDNFKREFAAGIGSKETAWAFVRQHLEKLPAVVAQNGKIEMIAERQAFLLFDRMVAYHIMNGISVPLDAADFYRGLDEKFLKRDDMYFLYDQINEYDTARIANEIESIPLYQPVTNEKSAILWLYHQLGTERQTYAELQPQFMREIKAIDRHEVMPELAVLLEENFLKAKDGKWYIPDVTKEADVTRLREKKLLKEFTAYLATKGKFKLFRTEAIRTGFAKLWADKNYKLIVETAERMPENVIQEDEKLLMYYDISLGRV